MAKSIHFILGGTRSGKSTRAEKIAAGLGDDVLYVAAAEPIDDGMRERISRHRAMRPAHWGTLEVPTGVGPAILEAQAKHPRPVVLVECLTLLAFNIIMAQPEHTLETSSTFESAMDAEIGTLLAAARRDDAHWVIVSSETGLGVVPPTRIGVVYCDGLGRANQTVAAAATDVTFMVAGIPWKIKESSGHGAEKIAP